MILARAFFNININSFPIFTISGQLSRNSSVVMLTTEPIPELDANFIRGMSVHIIDKPVVDENSISYGQQIEHFRNLIVSYMRALYDDLVYHDSFQRHLDLEQEVRDTVEEFIGENYFVDKNALREWLSGRENTQQHFQEMRQKVIEMFRKLIYDGPNSMVLTWVKELFDARRR